MAADKENQAVDSAVGKNIILRRRLVGMSQQTLGQSLGVSFQQVQKYERGTNRVSASMLWRAAGVLECEVADFFDGVTRQSRPIGERKAKAQSPEQAVRLLLTTPGGLELAKAFGELSEEYRRALLAAAKALRQALPD